MSGPWIHLPGNQEYFLEQRQGRLTVAEGGYLELHQFDDDGERQGTALWQIDRIIDKKEGLWFNARLVAATDVHLNWWLAKGPGKDSARTTRVNLAYIHLCATPAGGCRKTKRHRQQEFHSDTLRHQLMDILDACPILDVEPCENIREWTMTVRGFQTEDLDTTFMQSCS